MNAGLYVGVYTNGMGAQPTPLPVCVVMDGNGYEWMVLYPKGERYLPRLQNKVWFQANNCSGTAYVASLPPPNVPFQFFSDGEMLRVRPTNAYGVPGNMTSSRTEGGSCVAERLDGVDLVPIEWVPVVPDLTAPSARIEGPLHRVRQ